MFQHLAGVPHRQCTLSTAPLLFFRTFSLHTFKLAPRTDIPLLPACDSLERLSYARRDPPRAPATGRNLQ